MTPEGRQQVTREIANTQQALVQFEQSPCDDTAWHLSGTIKNLLALLLAEAPRAENKEVTTRVNAMGNSIDNPTASEHETTPATVTPNQVSAALLSALRWRVESEHDSATHWPKGSARYGHKGDFNTCPHGDCRLVSSLLAALPETSAQQEEP